MCNCGAEHSYEGGTHAGYLARRPVGIYVDWANARAARLTLIARVACFVVFAHVAAYREPAQGLVLGVAYLAGFLMVHVTPRL